MVVMLAKLSPWSSNHSLTPACQSPSPETWVAGDRMFQPDAAGKGRLTEIRSVLYPGSRIDRHQHMVSFRSPSSESPSFKATRRNPPRHKIASIPSTDLRRRWLSAAPLDGPLSYWLLRARPGSPQVRTYFCSQISDHHPFSAITIPIFRICGAPCIERALRRILRFGPRLASAAEAPSL